MKKEVAEAIRWEQENSKLKVVSAAEIMARPRPGDDVPEWTGGPLTWPDVVEIEPRLRSMRQLIQALCPPPGPWCSNRLWSDVLKPRLKELVGWSCKRRNPALRSSEAYDAAYRALYDALPPCRDCGCA